MLDVNLCWKSKWRKYSKFNSEKDITIKILITELKNAMKKLK